MGAPLLPSVEVLFKQSDPDKQRVSRLFVKLALGKSNTLIGCVTVAVQVVLLVNRTITELPKQTLYEEGVILHVCASALKKAKKRKNKKESSSLVLFISDARYTLDV